MSDRAPYSRLYWTVRSDPRLAGIYSDDHHWATWSRLLLAADMAWPAPADLPATARRASVVALEAAGVIERLPGGLFTFHGLDAERGRRKEAATSRGPNGTRTVPERGPSRAEPSKDEPSLAETPRADDPASIYWNLTGKFPSDKALRWIDQLTEEFGADSMNRYLAEAAIADGTSQTLLGRVQDLCRSKARQLSLNERAVEKTRITERRRDPNVVRAYHQAGQHVEAPDPTCALCQKGAA